MRLPKPFYKLAVHFDVDRLRKEVAALDTWANHPNEIRGNTSLRLISVDGGENDGVDGVMLPTQHLQRSPYIRQVLSSFGVVWSRSRLLRLAPGANVPQHADINYHWFNRVRLHIPIVTRPEVRFHCDDQSVHMRAGEAWIFDNWRVHRVENPTEYERIHLVADTSGSSAFWRFVAQSDAKTIADQQHRYDPNLDVHPLTERTKLARVMTPAEVELLVNDLRGELMPLDPNAPAAFARYHAMLESMCRDWRQLYALHGEDGYDEFVRLRDSVRATSATLGESLVMRTNRVAAHQVLEGRVLRAMLSASPSPSRSRSSRTQIKRPIFIVAAPRSGSTLLFETLAVTPQLATVGGEAHWLVEGTPELRPGAPGVDSNRLTEAHVTADVERRIVSQITERMQDCVGQPVADLDRVRFLEKTPKNSLRIPFFARIFPDAQFVFLWRDPRENLSSIMEAWRNGTWKTYNGLEGFEGPWSMLLPPGWREMNRQPLERIAAFQWSVTNRMILEDLAKLPKAQWTSICYEELLKDPTASIRSLCRALGLEFDAALAERTGAPLPNARYTLTPPAPKKWSINRSEIESVLPSLESTWERLRQLQSPT